MSSVWVIEHKAKYGKDFFPMRLYASANTALRDCRIYSKNNPRNEGYRVAEYVRVEAAESPSKEPTK